VRGVGSDDLLAVLPEGHSAAAGERVEVSELADENWIAGCPRCRGHLLELCGRAGFEPRIGFETDNFVAVEGLVAQGIGVATLPRMAVESFPLMPGVITRPLPHAEARTLHVVTAHGAERVPAVRIALAALTRVLA
jgi:DNA-binding transcriptional LysR family regulator